MSVTELITLNSDEVERNVPILGQGAAVDVEVGLLEVRTDYLGQTLFFFSTGFGAAEQRHL